MQKNEIEPMALVNAGAFKNKDCFNIDRVRSIGSVTYCNLEF